MDNKARQFNPACNPMPTASTSDSCVNSSCFSVPKFTVDKVSVIYLAEQPMQTNANAHALQMEKTLAPALQKINETAVHQLFYCHRHSTVAHFCRQCKRSALMFEKAQNDAVYTFNVPNVSCFASSDNSSEYQFWYKFHAVPLNKINFHSLRDDYPASKLLSPNSTKNLVKTCRPLRINSQSRFEVESVENFDEILANFLEQNPTHADDYLRLDLSCTIADDHGAAEHSPEQAIVQYWRSRRHLTINVTDNSLQNVTVIFPHVDLNEPAIDNPIDLLVLLRRIRENTPNTKLWYHRFDSKWGTEGLYILPITPTLFINLAIILSEASYPLLHYLFVSFARNGRKFQNFPAQLAYELVSSPAFTSIYRNSRFYFDAIPNVCLCDYCTGKEYFNAQPSMDKSLEKTLNNYEHFSLAHPNLIALSQQKIGAIRRSRGITEQIKTLNNALFKIPQNNISRRSFILARINESEKHLKRQQQIVAELATAIKRESSLIDQDIYPAHPSGDVDAEIDPISDQAENTILSAVSPDNPVEVVAQPPNNSYALEIVSDIPKSFQTLTDRFVLHREIQLSNSIVRGQLIAQLHYPADFVIDKWSTPNNLPFHNHEFFTGSMELKFQWNIPKTNQFIAQAGIVYHFLQRDRRSELVNPWTISQQPNARLNGSFKDSDVITVPFVSYVPWIPIRANTQMLNLYYFTVNVIAFSNFEVSPDSKNTATLAVYIRFLPDLKFSGQRETLNDPPPFTVPIPAHPSMFTAGAKVVGKGAAKVAKTATGAVSSAVSEVGSGLLSNASNLITGRVKSSSASLRSLIESKISNALSPKGTNQDKPSDLDNSVLHQRAMTNIASGSGHYSVDSFRLQENGTTPHPDFLLGVEKYDSVLSLAQILGFVNSFTVPTSTLQGTLLCSLSVQPGDTQCVFFGANFPNDISNWTPQDHMMGWFDNYRGLTEFNFVCAIDGFKTCRLRIAYTPNARTLTYENSNSVYFETFDIGAGLDSRPEFSFTVPFIHHLQQYQPYSDNNTLLLSGSVHIFLETEVVAPANVFDSFDILIYKRACPSQFEYSIPRDNISLFQNDSDSLGPSFNMPMQFIPSGFIGGGSTWACTFNIVTPFGTLTRIVGSAAGPQTLSFINPIYWRSNLDPILIFDNTSLARVFTIQMHSSAAAPNMTISSNFDTYNENTLVDGSTMIDNITTNYSVSYYGASPTPFLEAHPSGDLRDDLADSQSTVPGLQLGAPVFHGESHLHLYENVRRFEHFHDLTINVPNTTEMMVIAKLPLNLGSPLIRSNVPLFNRGNKITHLHDGFRFYRGSLRYLFTTNTIMRGTLRLIHVPQSSTYPLTIGDQLNPSLYSQHGYGETVFAFQQNNNMTVEVPLYLPTTAVLCASYLSTERSVNISQGLGNLYLAYQGPDDVIQLNISRALGDDGQFYVFNGFPIRELAFPRVTEDFLSPISARPSMLKIDLSNVNNAADSISTLCNNVSNFLNPVSTSEHTGVLAATLGVQIGHCLINPSIKTFCFAITQILISFNVLNSTLLNRLDSVLTSIYNYFFQSARPSADTDIDTDIDEVSNLSSILVTGVSSYFCPNSRKSSSFAERLSVSFAQGATMHERIVGFIKSMLNFIKRCATWVCGKFFPDSTLHKYLKADQYKIWLQRVATITDPTIFSKIKSSAKAISLVSKLVAEGRRLCLKLATTRKGPLQSLISQNLTAIIKLHDKISIDSAVPNVKLDPFAIYIYGESQTGKSHCLNGIALKLKDFVTNPGIFLAPKSDKFWEGYDNQSIVIFDDFMYIDNCADPTESDMARFAGIKGAAFWDVPHAFEAKGRKCVAELVICASNKPFPTQKGIDSKTIFKRRNIFAKYTVDFSCYNKCDLCNAFSFKCTRCLALNPIGFADGMAHARFQLFHSEIVSDSASPISNLMNYPEFLDLCHHEAEVFYEHARYNQKQQLSTALGLEGTRSLSNYPKQPHDDFSSLISDDEFRDVVDELGGTVDATPSMFRNIWSFFTGKPQERHPDGECLHIHLSQPPVLDLASDIYYWPEENLNSEPCCSACVWSNISASMFREWAAIRHKSGGLTFRGRYIPVHYLYDFEDSIDRAQNELILVIEEENWFMRHKALTSAIAIGLGILGTYAVYKVFSDPPQIAQDPTKPAMFVSGDIKTKFAPKMRSPRITARMMKNAKPSNDQKTELEQLYSVYDQSVFELRTNDKSCSAFCIGVAPNVYITQLHALCTILMRTKKAMDEDRSCDAGCKNLTLHDPNGKLMTGLQHSQIHTDRRNEKNQLILMRKRKDGSVLEVSIRLDDFFSLNECGISVDHSGGDYCLFKLNLENFHTENISKYIMSERSTEFISKDSYQYRFFGRTNANETTCRTAENVREHIGAVHYSYDDIKEWAEESLMEIAIPISGFMCKNTLGEFAHRACGSILVDTLTLQIVGIMSASSKEYLFFNAFSKEMLNDALSYDMLTNTKSVSVPMIQIKSRIISLPDEHSSIYKAAASMPVYHSTKTTLRKSVCHEAFGEVVRIPCNLSQDGDRGQTAIRNGLLNYLPHKDFPEEHITQAVDDLKDCFKKKCRPTIPVVSRRGLKEAVCGIEGHVPRICMSTGPGFPWCTDSTTKRKSDLLAFDDEHHLVGIDKYLNETLEVEDEQMRDGEVPLTIYQLSLKDERLPIHKANNVRLIQGSSLHLTIAARRYLMDFNYAFQECRRDLEHAVGINPMSMEWHDLASSLLANSHKICVGDYSKFGPRLSSRFVKEAYEIMADWYNIYSTSVEDDIVRRVLGYRAMNSYNAYFNEIVQLHCGSPSGAINTVIVNSICNLLYIRCAWIGIMRKLKPEISSLNHFRDFVVFYCYGDDVIFSVKEEVIELFNNRTISEYFATFNIKYTDVMKDSEMRAYCSIHEATFLKCGFRIFSETELRNGVWICFPFEEDIRDTTNWVRKPKGCKSPDLLSETLISAAATNCEDSIRKMWFHGKQKFEDYQEKIETWWFANHPNHPIKHFHFESLQLEYGYPLKLKKDGLEMEMLKGEKKPMPPGAQVPDRSQSTFASYMRFIEKQIELDKNWTEVEGSVLPRAFCD